MNASSTATAIQFPLRLAYAATAHKIQGHTVKKPQPLVVDLVTWLQPAMAYVMLSRVQSLTQLYIIDSIPTEKIRPWPSALEEVSRMNEMDLSNQNKTSQKLKIVSLNTLSLQKHFSDVNGDPNLYDADIVCLQETWLPYSGESNDHYKIGKFQSHFNNVGRGKGIVTFHSENFSHIKDIKTDKFQISKIESHEYSVINVYRSGNAGKTFLDNLISLIDFDRNVIICGDFNFCSNKENHHQISLELKNMGFIQMVNEPTHREGQSLDHLYVFLKNKSLQIECKVKGVYYSDHDQLTFLIHETENKIIALRGI